MDKKPKAKDPSGSDPASFADAVLAARAKLQLTQSAFARLLETPLGTVRGWEQGRRKPPPCALLLMRIAVEQPDAVMDASRHHLPDSANGGGRETEKAPKNADKGSRVMADLHEPGDEIDFWLL